MPAATTTAATDKTVRNRTFTIDEYKYPIDCERF
jgi:hypothetical protein